MGFEAEIKKNLLNFTRFYVDENEVCFDGKTIPTKNIAGFGCFSIQQTSGIIRSGRILALFIYELGKTKPYKLVGTYPVDGREAEKNFALAMEALWKYVGDHLRETLHASLLAGKELILEKGLKVNAAGAFTAKPGLFKMGALNFTPWNDLTTYIHSDDDLFLPGQEDLVVKRISTQKTVSIFHLGRNNICLFNHYIQWLQQHPQDLQTLLAQGKER
jgi:hypothetical protein